MLAVPMSPAVENLTPSLVTEMITANIQTTRNQQTSTNKFLMDSIKTNIMIYQCLLCCSGLCKSLQIPPKASSQWLGTRNPGCQGVHCLCPSASFQSQQFCLDLIKMNRGVIKSSTISHAYSQTLRGHNLIVANLRRALARGILRKNTIFFK